MPLTGASKQMPSMTKCQRRDVSRAIERPVQVENFLDRFYWVHGVL